MNALNIETIREVGEALAEANADAEVFGIILTGAGNKSFIAGADISEFADFDVAEGTEMSAKGHAVFNALEQSPKPVIAAINGFSLGGGNELAMACTFRIATAKSKFGQPEVNLGLIPGYGGSQRLIRLIGYGKAMELLLTGDMINAEQALSLGLVNHVVEEEELIPLATKLLKKIGSKSPLTVAQLIKLGNQYYDPAEDGLANEIVEFGRCFGTEDFKEGTQAFLGKRKPSFKGA